MDSVEINAAFASKHKFPYPLLSDAGGQVCRAYGACSEAGQIRRNTVIIGPDGKIHHIFEDVKPENHAETVLAFLEATAMAIAPIGDQTPQINLKGESFSLKKGVQANMDDQQDVENGTGCQAATLDRQGKRSEVLAEMERATLSPPTSARPTESTAALFTESHPAVWPSQMRPAQASGAPSLVFALGMLGIDFGTEARRDSIAQHMAGSDNPAPNPQDPAQLLAYFEANPDQVTAVSWTLSLDATPIYAVLPCGPFAATVYERLRQFLDEQYNEGVERVSVAGMIIGQVRLMSGQTVPLICPELRCMYSWSTAALVEAIGGKEPEKEDDYAQSLNGTRNFLERIYHELRNLGLTAQDRAINYAATNALNVAKIFEAALEAAMELDTIEVERSPICRPDSDCWDVILCFFDPENVLRSRKCYRFTVDVSDVCPVTVGDVRSWAVR